MKIVFGPVPSRRLGRSLGIDVVPAKTCSYDCIYCESGKTTHLTLRRKAFVDPDRVLLDLEDYFRHYPRGADVLTFSSAGEPTLYEPLGELIPAIKRRFPLLPLVVLTNGSLLWDEEVRRGLLEADRVVPSLDAVSEVAFQRVNRPHPLLDLPTIIEGLTAFRKDYRGEFHLEVMLVAGGNDKPEELGSIRKAIDRIDPDRIELNTVVRPPADSCAKGLSHAEMESVRLRFPLEKTRIIGTFQREARSQADKSLGNRILELVRRRPCTVTEMAVSLGVVRAELELALSEMERENRLVRTFFNDLEYVCPASESA